MQKIIVKSEQMKLVGISVRTNNQTENDPDNAVIGPLVEKYFREKIVNQIANKKNPGTTISAYLNYESDYTGDYTYMIGEEVTDFNSSNDDQEVAIIPAQTYCKFTTDSGQMPNVVIDAWEAIWSMNAEDFGGERAYKGDFELYDLRAHDMENAIVDIYIGIKQKN